MIHRMAFTDVTQYVISRRYLKLRLVSFNLLMDPTTELVSTRTSLKWEFHCYNNSLLKEALPFLHVWIDLCFAGFLFCLQLELSSKQNWSVVYWPVRSFLVYNYCIFYIDSSPENPWKRFGFADKIISQRESRALNLMSICFLLTYVISYWPLLAFHVLRCFEYAGLTAQVFGKYSNWGTTFQHNGIYIQKCESIRRVVETLPWFQPVINPMIFIFFGTICGPIPTQCTLCELKNGHIS